MGRFVAYLNERFPAWQVAGQIPSFLVAFLAGQLFVGRPAAVTSAAYIGFVAFVAYIFAARALDDHKDYDHDTRHYPERVLQSGRITLTHLKSLAVLCFALSLVGSLVIDRGVGWVTFWWVISVATNGIFQISMIRNPTMKAWLEERRVIFALAHLPFWGVAGVWIAQMGVGDEALPWSVGWLVAVWIVGPLLLEFARKSLAPEDERSTVVDYTKPRASWAHSLGLQGAVAALVMLAVLTALLGAALLRGGGMRYSDGVLGPRRFGGPAPDTRHGPVCDGAEPQAGQGGRGAFGQFDDRRPDRPRSRDALSRLTGLQDTDGRSIMEFAIIGVAIRLPGVGDIDEFHTSLLAGRSGLREVSPEDSLRNGVTEAEIANPRYVPVASPVECAELFDREFFGMTAGEAASIDPQHRLLLTLAHEALESSGLDRAAQRIGIYTSTTLSAHYLQRSETDGSLAISYKSMLGNDKDFCSARIAYKLGLTGPAIAVQSACSSSLVAVHQACGALAFGDADAAIVGGVSVSIPQLRGYLYQEGGVLSPTGQCRPFDSASNGTLKGNGGGAVVLRRLDDAIADGDPILGVISGSAVNNDGRDRMGFTAPSVRGQQQVIGAALERAGIDATDVRYIETHGTGTQLGDPIEFRALASVYDSGPDLAPAVPPRVAQIQLRASRRGRRHRGADQGHAGGAGRTDISTNQLHRTKPLGRSGRNTVRDQR